MAKKHDDLAAALNAMADGQHAEDESTESHHGDEDGHQAPAVPPPVQPARPAMATRPASTTPPPVTRSARPTAPAAPAAKVVPPQPAAPVEAKPAARARPSAPSNRPTAPSVSVAPPTPAGADDPFDHAPPDDDDAVIVPAPDQSVFAPRPKPAPVVRKARVPVYQTLQFRQTVIPIMLTSGTLAILLALVRFSLTDDSIFAAVPATVAIILLVIGLLLLGAAGLNIMQVKQMLDADKPASR